MYRDPYVGLADPATMVPPGFEPAAFARYSRLRDAFLPAMVGPMVGGLRCLIVEGRARLADLSPIMNRKIGWSLADLPHGYDGELVTFTNGKPDCLSVIRTKVNSKKGWSEAKFFVMDTFVGPDRPFWERYEYLSNSAKRLGRRRPAVELVVRRAAYTTEELQEAEDEAVAAGWRGLYGWHPQLPYGRGESGSGPMARWQHTRRGRNAPSGTA